MKNFESSITILSDEDGFISLECPFCGELFKLNVTEYESENPFSLFCPYCGLESECINFLSKEAKEKIAIELQNLVNMTINDLMSGIEKSFKSSKNISFKKGKNLPLDHVESIFEKEEMNFAHLDCCDKNLKVKLSLSEILYCPYCGII